MQFCIPRIRDLENCFPVLRDAWDQHLYAGIYYLWKLSYMFGQAYADQSFSMEDLVQNPRRTLEPVFDDVGIPDVSWSPLLDLVSKPKLGKWRDYANAEWFEETERKCSQTLVRVFGDVGAE